ncbi:MAG TPA: 50S ribosomal protein L18 [Acidobacteriota bacterium]|jgi:large subunit ribosomal protein L18|nr:50S ribosomal protein L18 [Acidobacteriota bacterium]HNT16466.1 50S ribosomal protein L18 [Acidobacteriota bacterium]HPA27284.1 50S ribosomal protein L18 [Acidobacteriota bacterium]HQO20548.1 50S ribosomal protein L18 [Acidobacteriota bacterium]HQQ47066.1 50S ribosomal protein L18 [Acidobacteriota bacterium]
MSNHRHFSSNERREWRKIRVFDKIRGTAERPRLAVYRSEKYLYVQAIDDSEGKTIVSASSLEKEFKNVKTGAKKNLKIAEKLGELVSERLKSKGIETVVFDRSGYRYHGRVKTLAEAVRKSGVKC